MGVVFGTVIYIILFVAASILINNHVQKDVTDPKIKTEYRNLTFGLTFFGVFCMWLMWFSVYMHQMNPLITPIMETGHE